MNFRTSVVGSLLTAAMLAIPTAGQAARYIEYDVEVAPPPARVEVVPAPREGYAWERGYWRHDGPDYVWEPGRYVEIRPGHEYVAPTWEQRGPRWHFRAGHWDDDD